MKKSYIVILGIAFTFGLTGLNAVEAAGPAIVNLGSAGDFVILAKTGISTTGTTSVVGNIGVSPAEATYITGFGLILPAASAFSTSALVTGKVYAPSYANPTPANLTTAVSDMETAYTNANGRTNPTATELGAGNIGGMTLAPGLYKWSTGVTIPTNVTLSGGANDVWIFQVAQNLDISSATRVILSGGAQASNIFWAVAGQTTLGTTSVFNGNILDQTTIVLNTGAQLNGRALAQSAVTLDASTVILPTYTPPTPVISTPTPVACTMEAMQCSDGSYVSRQGPMCTFATCPSATPAVPATQIEGCVSGNLFSATSGRSCTVSATPAVPATRVVIAGCEERATGFSRSSGQTCVGNSVSATTRARYNLGLTTLRNGSRGEAVMELQRFLNARLNLGLVVDGKLGPKTIAVIKQWQMDKGLVADGLIGVKTKAMINSSAQ